MNPGTRYVNKSQVEILISSDLSAAIVPFALVQHMNNQSSYLFLLEIFPYLFTQEVYLNTSYTITNLITTTTIQERELNVARAGSTSPLYEHCIRPLPEPSHRQRTISIVKFL